MKITQKLILLFVWLSTANFSFSQDSSDTAKINFIKTQFSAINSNLNSFKKVEVEDTAETTEGNEVVKYFSGNEIEKIKAVYYGETGKATDEYYFFNNKLIFYYRAVYRYDVPIYANNGKVKTRLAEETRYYFNGDKIFLARLNPKRVVPQAEYQKMSVETQKEAGRMIKL